MSSKQATSPFASGLDGGEDGASQEHLVWEKEESAEALVAPQLPLHNLLHSKPHPEELPPVSSSVPPESDWDSLVSAQQRMVRHHTPTLCSPHCQVTVNLGAWSRMIFFVNE